MIGQTISRCEILAKLGEVYKAADTALKHTMTLKCLTLQVLGCEKMMKCKNPFSIAKYFLKPTGGLE